LRPNKPMMLVSYSLVYEYRTVKTNGACFWACSRPTTPPRWGFLPKLFRLQPKPGSLNL
jgi:hypothetical protein